MKKLYICFILLFGFLTFVPQIALGDLRSPNGIHKYHHNQAVDLKDVVYQSYNKDLNYTPTTDIQFQDDSIPDFAVRGMLIALLLTIIIEGIIALPFGWKFVGLVTLANIITNPALNGIIWHYQITNTQTILLLEAAVVLAEWGIFSVFIRQKYLKLFLFALVANAVSYLSGLLIF